MKELLELYGFHVEKITAGSYGLPEVLDRLAVAMDKHHGIYTTVKARVPVQVSRLGVVSLRK